MMTTRVKRGGPTSWRFDPDGKNERIYASGIRNAVGLAIHPETGQLWASVNERDALGDHLVPDYVTHVEEGGFYGWPWYYIGANQDPRHKGKHPELKDKVIVPDVLVQSHSASLCMTFYTGSQFPKEYRLDGFAAEHGSWNRARRTGYKVIRIPMKDGKATGEYEDFLVGFVTPEGNVWGRPVGVTVAKDGALLVTDDGSGIVWRVAYISRGTRNDLRRNDVSARTTTATRKRAIRGCDDCSMAVGCILGPWFWQLPRSLPRPSARSQAQQSMSGGSASGWCRRSPS